MNDIADGIEKLCKSLFADAEPTTKAIAKAFGDLGIKNKYYVASRTYKPMMAHDAILSGNLDGEWLYDLCWYSTEKYYKELVLILESELSHYQKDDVDNDFGKLVQARAGLRVWIAKVKSAQMVDAHVDACMLSAREFSRSLADDAYLFLIYDESSNTLVTRRRTVNG